jgi:glycerophosphoryl diester phosphodiesterase
VLAYTVNDPRDMAALFRMGVDGIFTDDPEVARTTLSAMQGF